MDSDRLGESLSGLRRQWATSCRSTGSRCARVAMGSPSPRGTRRRHVVGKGHGAAERERFPAQVTAPRDISSDHCQESCSPRFNPRSPPFSSEFAMFLSVALAPSISDLALIPRPFLPRIDSFSKWSGCRRRPRRKALLVSTLRLCRQAADERLRLVYATYPVEVIRTLRVTKSISRTKSSWTSRSSQRLVLPLPRKHAWAARKATYALCSCSRPSQLTFERSYRTTRLQIARARARASNSRHRPHLARSQSCVVTRFPRDPAHTRSAASTPAARVIPLAVRSSQFAVRIAAN